MKKSNTALKRLVSLALASAAAFSLCLGASAAGAAYRDVPKDAWYASDLRDLSAAGVVMITPR